MKTIQHLFAAGSRWDDLFTTFPTGGESTHRPQVVFNCSISTGSLRSHFNTFRKIVRVINCCRSLWCRCCSTLHKGASSSLEELHGKPAPVPDFAGTSKNRICMSSIFDHSISRVFTRMVYTPNMQNRVVIQNYSLISVGLCGL